MRTEDDTKRTRLQNWLNTIQQDSWQLELVISGIVIFLLLGAYEPLQAYRFRVAVDVLTGNAAVVSLAAAFVVLRVAYFTLLLTFMLHLLLRGIWIGAVGLRSVSGDFDYEVIGYQPKFTNWLKGQLGTFDDYIERLEIQCSVAFSFAFLLFFSVISVGLYLSFLAGATFVISELFGISDSAEAALWKVGLLGAVMFFLVALGLLYLIDFSSLGWFKKRRFFQRIYFPLYRVMGWLTLAWLYRPFYYNLIDHPFGRKLVRWLWLVLFGALTLASITIVRYPYFPTATAGASIIHPGVYLDELPLEKLDIRGPSLASRYAERDYLEVFIPYRAASNDRVIKHLFPNLAAAHTAGFAIDGPINLYNSRNNAVNNDSLLYAHRAIHRLYLNDSLLVDVPWRFYRHPLRHQPGLRYDLPVYDLPRGEHELRFEGYVLTPADSLYWKEQFRISFLR